MSIAKRVEDLEARETITAIIVTSDPNGVTVGVASMFALNVNTNLLYVCYGGTNWKRVMTIDDTLDIDISLTFYDAEPSRSSETNLLGGLLELDVGSSLSTGTNINVTKGTGKLFFVLNTGSDVTGSITITGDSVDRNTKAITNGYVDTIYIDTLSTDSSTTDSNGNTKHNYTNGYITNVWFTGAVTVSTTNLTITDMDTYHISFHQFNDKPNITLDSFDTSLYTTNNSAEFDAYLFSLRKLTGNKANVELEAELHVGTGGEPAIANKYWRLRQGYLTDTIDGRTDGIWADIHYSNSPAYIEDVTLIINATRTYS